MSYLGIDVGTSRTKAVAYDDSFRPLAESNTAYERVCPQRGWYEIDAAELGRAVQRVVAECSQQCGNDPIRWLSCSVFGGGISALDAQLRPLVNVISTTDQRAQPQAEDWCRRFGRERTYHITGTTTHPSLMLPKILWIEAHLEQSARIDRFVTAAEIVQAALGIRPKMDLGHSVHDDVVGHQPTALVGRNPHGGPDSPPSIARADRTGRGCRYTAIRSL